MVASITVPVTRGAGKELPIPVVVVNESSISAGGASGKTAVTGTFVATGQSASFTPLAGRDFNVTISGGVGTVQVERRFGGAGSWFVVLTDALRTSLPESFTLNEAEASVEYRLNCTVYTSGTFTYRVSQ